jgi:hypothetical protein
VDVTLIIQTFVQPKGFKCTDLRQIPLDHYYSATDFGGYGLVSAEIRRRKSNLRPHDKYLRARWDDVVSDELSAGAANTAGRVAMST